MFDNLLNIVKEHAGEAIINNPAIPNEKNNDAIASTTNSIVDVLKNQLTSGNLSSVTDLFKGGASNINASSINSVVNSKVATDLMTKFGIDSTQANGIAQKIIPVVMEKFVTKTNDPNDKSFDLNDIVSSLGGGNVGGMLGKITNLFK